MAPSEMRQPRFLLALCALFTALTCQAGEHSRIAVDVGHSRAQPGATSAHGAHEFDFNLALAQAITEALAAKQVRVDLIGADGNATSLHARTQAATALGADFFLSVHHDSAQPRYLEPWRWQGEKRLHTERFSGYSLFVSRKNPAREQSLNCARQMGLALQRAGFVASPHHAEPIPGENREWADQPSGVYYFDDLVVLKTASVPAVLLEAGVIVNRDEALRLQSVETRQRIAAAVTEGLTRCGAIK